VLSWLEARELIAAILDHPYTSSNLEILSHCYRLHVKTPSIRFHCSSYCCLVVEVSCWLWC